MKHRLRVRVDLFFNHISELIRNVNLGGGSNTFLNAPPVDIYGGEAGIEFLATKWLTGFANYSYQEFGQGQSVTDLSRRGGPRFKANAGLRAEWENGLSAEGLVHYYGSAVYPINTFFFSAANFPGGLPPPNVRVGSYVLLNLRAGYRIWQQRKIGREAEIAVSAFNALNDRHQEHPTGDIIGSRVMGWLTVKY